MLDIALARQVASLPLDDLVELESLVRGLLGRPASRDTVAGLDLSAWRGFREVALGAQSPTVARTAHVASSRREFTASNLEDCLRYWAEVTRGKPVFLVWGGSDNRPQRGTVRWYAKQEGLDYGGRAGFRIANAWKELADRGVVRSGKRARLGTKTEDFPTPQTPTGPSRRYFWLTEFEEEARDEAAREGWAIVVDGDDDRPLSWLVEV